MRNFFFFCMIFFLAVIVWLGSISCDPCKSDWSPGSCLLSHFSHFSLIDFIQLGKGYQKQLLLAPAIYSQFLPYQCAFTWNYFVYWPLAQVIKSLHSFKCPKWTKRLLHAYFLMVALYRVMGSLIEDVCRWKSSCLLVVSHCIRVFIGLQSIM